MIQSCKTGLLVDRYIPVEVVRHVASADIHAGDDYGILVLLLVASACLGYVDTIFLSVVAMQTSICWVTLLFLLFERIRPFDHVRAVSLTLGARWNLLIFLILEVAHLVALIMLFLFRVLRVEDLRLVQAFGWVFLWVRVEVIFDADLYLAHVFFF